MLTQRGRLQAGDAIRTEVHVPAEVVVGRGGEDGSLKAIACGFNHSVSHFGVLP
jgi:hypothetical protein